MRKLSFTTLFVLGSTRRFLTSISVVFTDVSCKLFTMAYLLAMCMKCLRTTERCSFCINREQRLPVSKKWWHALPQLLSPEPAWRTMRSWNRSLGHYSPPNVPSKFTLAFLASEKPICRLLKTKGIMINNLNKSF